MVIFPINIQDQIQEEKKNHQFRDHREESMVKPGIGDAACKIASECNVG